MFAFKKEKAQIEHNFKEIEKTLSTVEKAILVTSLEILNYANGTSKKSKSELIQNCVYIGEDLNTLNEETANCCNFMLYNKCDQFIDLLKKGNQISTAINETMVTLAELSNSLNKI